MGSRWAGAGTLAEVRLWGTPRVAPALLRMATGHRALRQVPGLRFAKLLGTGSGRTFTPRDADPHHWGVLTVWSDPGARAAFEDSALVASWRGAASEELRVQLAPLTARGRWSGVEPFVEPGPLETRDGAWEGPVAAITRARLRTSRTAAFWRAVPPVVGDLTTSPGLRLAVGVGESPVGLQGTFSLWGSSDDLVAFAYRSAAHREVVRRTDEARWYVEEMFARLAVTDIRGTYEGRTP